MNSTDQYIYRIRPTRIEMLTDGPTDVETKILGDHVAYLDKLAGDGVVLLAGRTQTADEHSFGIVILQSTSYAQARRIMEDDPAVLHGIMEAELFPYRIAVMSGHIQRDDKDEA